MGKVHPPINGEVIIAEEATIEHLTIVFRNGIRMQFTEPAKIEAFTFLEDQIDDPNLHGASVDPDWRTIELVVNIKAKLPRVKT